MTPFHEPFKPSSFVCEPASALVITKSGEIEAISPKCSAPVTTFSKFAGIGRTASLLDDELLIIGNDDDGTKGRYISIQKPRDGLLAMKYIIQELPLLQQPHQHSSLVSRNFLSVVGGKFGSGGKLSKSTWTELSLKMEDKSRYIPSFSDACVIKVGVDVHILFGGERTIGNKTTSSRQVVKINTTEEIVYEMKPMTYSRVSHDCELLNSSVVLVSGGLPSKGDDPTNILPDELYDIHSQKVIKVLEAGQSLKRIQHSTIKMGNRILALGGIDSNNTAPSMIKEFVLPTSSWKDLKQKLNSTNTDDLIIAPFPTASMDCMSNCRCGIVNRDKRIFGGSEAAVRSN